MSQSRKLQTRRLDDPLRVTGVSSDNEFALDIGVPNMIAFVVPEMQARIFVQVTGTIFIGRSVADDETDSFIDLHPFGADDHGVSRKHLRLWPENGELFIEDLASTNGTWLNAARLADHTPQRIHHADALTLGGLELRVEFIYDLLA